MNITRKRFKSNDGKLFHVKEVSMGSDNKLWVYYNEVDKEHEYSCLLEAFTDRFTLTEEE